MTVLQVEDPSYMGPRIDKLMTAVHDAARDRVKQKEVEVSGGVRWGFGASWAYAYQGSQVPGGGSPEGRKKKINPAMMTLLGGKEEEVDGLYAAHASHAE